MRPAETRELIAEGPRDRFVRSSGGPAAETVRFAFGGADYEIDLNKKNAAAFRKQFAPFIEHARKAGRGPGRRGGAHRVRA